MRARIASIRPLLVALLGEHGPGLDPALRLSLVKALQLFVARRLLDLDVLLPLLFRLFRCKDRALRER